MKNILIIQGHPDSESFCWALGEAYKRGASSSGAAIQEIKISNLYFNPNLAFGYRKRTQLEPDLLTSWEKILKADHLVIIYPVWWASMPAIMKGFFDRLFLPGFAFEKIENSLWWKKLLKGKSARIITTMDQPPWYFWLRYLAPAHQALKHGTLKFCGVSPVKITSIGPIRLSKETFRKNHLLKIEKLGYHQK